MESTRWGKWHMDDDDRDLIDKYQIHSTEATHKHISSSYWRTINQLGPTRSTVKLILPACYQLDYVNWIQKTFDYLVTPAGQHTDSEFKAKNFLIPDTVVIRKGRAISYFRRPSLCAPLEVISKPTLLEPSLLLHSILGAARKLHPVITNTPIVAYLVASRLQDPKGWVSEVEYMTQGILEGYLERQLILEDREAMLQVFVPPAGSFNTLIRAWCVCE